MFCFGVLVCAFWTRVSACGIVVAVKGKWLPVCTPRYVDNACIDGSLLLFFFLTPFSPVAKSRFVFNVRAGYRLHF